MPGWRHYRDTFDLSALPAFVAEHWGADPNTIQLVERRLSIVCRLRLAGEWHYLRLSHPSIRQPQTARAAYHFQAYLAKSGVAVCAPRLAANGEHLVWLAQGGTRYFAGLVRAAPGAAIDPRESDRRVFRAWGRSIAELHEAASTYRPAPHQHHSIFDFYQNTQAQSQLADAAICALYSQLGHWLQELPRRDFALTHGDMHPANAFWDGRRVTIIDFDEPVYNWVWVDLGRALLDFYRRPPRQRRQLENALLEGYGAVRAIDETLRGALPRFMQLRGLLMHLWSLEDAAANRASGAAPEQRQWALGAWEW